MGIRQATVLFTFLGIGFLQAQVVPQEKAFEFIPPAIEVGLFGGDQLKMLPKERDEYATNLAALAGNLVKQEKASGSSLDTAKRILTVALHLSPRNRQALVVGFQLKKGVLPEEKKTDYSPGVLSRLLLTRSKLLAAEENNESKLLSRCFVELAATIDPRNEDAVFAFEIQRLDHGEIDWETLFVSPKKEG